MEYTLTFGRLKASVSSLGAELVSLIDAEGTEYIWQGHPSGWTGRNPNLFPVIGAVKPEGILYSGKAFPTPRHGFARHSEFSLIEKTESSVCLELRDSEASRELYPCSFRLRISHSLGESGFTTTYEVSNTGADDMHYCIGGHTAFNCPLRGEGDFSDWRIVFDENESADAMLPLPGGFISFENTMPAIMEGRYIPLDHSLHDRVDTLIFDGLRSRGISLVGPSGRGVHMDFSGFPMIAFWTAPGKNAPFICLEPWAGCGAVDGESGEFADKPHAICLAPGESKTLSYTVCII